MKKIALSVLTSSLIFGLSYSAPMKISTSFYYGGLNYDKSLEKDDGYVTGAYGYLGIGWYHSIEAAVDYTHINYKNDLPDLDQTDFTIVYSNYYIPKTKLKVGVHYIESDDKLSDGGYTIVLGVDRYEPYKWNIGADLFYTKYGDYINLDGSKGLDVYQITGRLGFYFGNYYKYGSFYFEILPTYISHSDNAAFGKNFSSVEAKLSYFIKNFSLTASAWTGERSFFVDNGGFVVFNLQEKYKWGTSMKAGYSINQKLGVSASIKYQTYKEKFNKDDVKNLVYVVNLGFSF